MKTKQTLPNTPQPDTADAQDEATHSPLPFSYSGIDDYITSKRIAIDAIREALAEWNKAQ